MAVLLFIVAGLLVGGTYSCVKQKLPVWVSIAVGLLAALALAGAILRAVPA